MGKTLTSVPFVDDSIKIVPHTASFEHNLNRPISIARFANGRPVTIYRVEETGEWYIVAGNYPDIDFIEGPESPESS